MLEDGGFSDPHLDGPESLKSVSVDKIIADGDVIELGENRLWVLETPGGYRSLPSRPFRRHGF